MTHFWWSERVGPGYIQGYQVEFLYEERTPYQHLLIFSSEFWGRVLALDGVVQLTERDESIYHEMMVHVPLAGRVRPSQSVLIIGGADGGTLREVITHDSVERVVQVELDQAVLTACRKYLPDVCHGWNDPRVELVIGDGSAYVREAAARGETFDVIILDSTDPVGPAIVLFEKPFHRDLYSCLSGDGVVVRQAGLPRTMPRVLPFVMKRFRDFFSVVEAYRAPVPTYGDEMAFVAATKDGASVREPQRNPRGQFYNPECHRAAFALPSWWQELMAGYEDDGKVPVGSL